MPDNLPQNLCLRTVAAEPNVITGLLRISCVLLPDTVAD
jgi:hypothetical protein